MISNEHSNHAGKCKRFCLPKVFFKLSWIALLIVLVGSVLIPSTESSFLRSLLTIGFISAIFFFNFLFFKGYSHLKKNISHHLKCSIEKFPQNRIQERFVKTTNKSLPWKVIASLKRKSGSRYPLSIQISELYFGKILFPASCIWCGSPAPVRYEEKCTAYFSENLSTSIKTTSLDYKVPITSCDKHQNIDIAVRGWDRYVDKLWTPFNVTGVLLYCIYISMVLMIGEETDRVYGLSWVYYTTLLLVIAFPFICGVTKKNIKSLGPTETLDYGFSYSPFGFSGEEFLFSNEEYAKQFLELNKKLPWSVEAKS